MKKYLSDWTVRNNIRKGDTCLLTLGLNDGEHAVFPIILPGQFVQIRVDGSPQTFLRRPISIHFVEPEKREIRLMVQAIGAGTRAISSLKAGDCINLLYPLGNGFTLPDVNSPKRRCLLVGGGVGSAPLLYLGHILRQSGHSVDYLLGAFSADSFFDNSPFEETGNLYLTTENGTAGVKGYVTDHSILKEEKYDFIYTCGPRPMMKAVAVYAQTHGIPCEASLENMMACGIGACLCCVEKTVKGNVCVCTEGPVFNINQLTF